MKRGFGLVVCTLLALALAPLARASVVTTIVAYPVASGASNVGGTFSTFAPGFDNSAWQSTAVGVGQKSEAYVPAGTLFPSSGPVHLSDIASVSYWTNKGTTAADPDWYLAIYTALTGSGDTGSFYHTRLNSEPYLTGTTGVAPSTWHTWATNDPTHPLRLYDQARDGNVQGTFTDPTLSALQAAAITWPTSHTTYDYRTVADTVSLFSFQTGNPWANGFTGLIDGVTVTLNNGDIGIINLEVPEPASLGLLSMATFGLALRRRRR